MEKEKESEDEAGVGGDFESFCWKRLQDLAALCCVSNCPVQHPPLQNSKCCKPQSPGSWMLPLESCAGTQQPGQEQALKLAAFPKVITHF